jgi:hypothetical protein
MTLITSSERIKEMKEQGLNTREMLDLLYADVSEADVQPAVVLQAMCNALIEGLSSTQVVVWSLAQALGLTLAKEPSAIAAEFVDGVLVRAQAEIRDHVLGGEYVAEEAEEATTGSDEADDPRSRSASENQ